MGQIQNTVNTMLGKGAAAATVIGIGKTVGDQLADEASRPSLEKAKKELEAFIDIGSKAYASGNKEDMRAARELGMEIKNSDDPYLQALNDLPALRTREMSKKAIRNVYYAQENTNSLKLGIKSVIDRITGGGK